MIQCVDLELWMALLTQKMLEVNFIKFSWEMKATPLKKIWQKLNVLKRPFSSLSLIVSNYSLSTDS